MPLQRRLTPLLRGDRLLLRTHFGNRQWRLRGLLQQWLRDQFR